MLEDAVEHDPRHPQVPGAAGRLDEQVSPLDDDLGQHLVGDALDRQPLGQRRGVRRVEPDEENPLVHCCPPRNAAGSRTIRPAGRPRSPERGVYWTPPVGAGSGARPRTGARCGLSPQGPRQRVNHFRYEQARNRRDGPHTTAGLISRAERLVLPAIIYQPITDVTDDGNPSLPT
ncbi:hypothetical protein R5W23_002075 [Gemmata sp. JC673]|uniref:Uncharacterized protein n=1 Tax=Gemmata algarum TaxID=2975278 RepID=A0ABU5EZV7_9BACT|nr:hypothetical protein [Gemmata algarum]MDY3560827.1 hypothetical protein [Gemmata algarum]